VVLVRTSPDAVVLLQLAAQQRENKLKRALLLSTAITGKDFI
jgi:hypothetical protein